jgi:hypothetical protein
MGWFSPSPICPLEPDRKASIDRQIAWLVSQFGRESIRQATVVMPTREFFPRAEDVTDAGIDDTFRRACSYMGLPPESVALCLYEEDQPPLAQYQTHWESSGAAGLFAAAAAATGGPRFYVALRVDHLAHPGRLIAVLVHELAHARLHGRLTGFEAELERERLTDLATVFLGLGLFTANAIIYEAKGHNPWIEGAYSMVGRLGYLQAPEFGYALGVFAWLRQEPSPTWGRYLRKDVKVPFEQTLAFLARQQAQGVPCDV